MAPKDRRRPTGVDRNSALDRRRWPASVRRHGRAAWLLALGTLAAGYALVGRLLMVQWEPRPRVDVIVPLGVTGVLAAAWWVATLRDRRVEPDDRLRPVAAARRCQPAPPPAPARLPRGRRWPGWTAWGGTVLVGLAVTVSIRIDVPGDDGRLTGGRTVAAGNLVGWAVVLLTVGGLAVAASRWGARRRLRRAWQDRAVAARRVTVPTPRGARLMVEGLRLRPAPAVDTAPVAADLAGASGWLCWPAADSRPDTGADTVPVLLALDDGRALYATVEGVWLRERIGRWGAAVTDSPPQGRRRFRMIGYTASRPVVRVVAASAALAWAATLLACPSEAVGWCLRVTGIVAAIVAQLASIVGFKDPTAKPAGTETAAGDRPGGRPPARGGRAGRSRPSRRRASTRLPGCPRRPAGNR